MTSQDLRDERDVCEVLYRLAEGMDLRDWALYRSAFVDSLTFDYTSYRPGSAGTVSADDWVARARRRFETLRATQHTLTNPRVRVEGDRATCSMHLQAWHALEVDGRDVHCTLRGGYRTDLVRESGQWRIEVLRLQVRGVEGDRSILDL